MKYVLQGDHGVMDYAITQKDIASKITNDVTWSYGTSLKMKSVAI